MKRSKAFRQVLDIKNPEYFDGSNMMKYLPWKIALQKEVSHLEIDPTQWLELIKIRTRKDAREVVDRACAPLLETSPERTLDRVWRFLDRRFKTPQKPSQDILSNLMYGAQIADRNVKGLSDFADLCDSAADLMQDSPGLSASLNEITTQDAIVNRLPPILRHEWFRHQCNVLDVDGPVAFLKLAEWIESQAKILRRESINLAGPIPPTPSVSRTQALKEGTIAQNERQGAAPSQPAYQPPHARGTSGNGTSPGPNRAPTNDCKICGRKDHDFALQCDRFQRMGVREQWEACTSDGKRMCRNCLKSRCELFGRCPERQGQCRTCQDSHHRDMQCKPEGMRSLSSPFNNRRK